MAGSPDLFTHLFGVLMRMADSPTKDMVVVYDLRRDQRYREQILSGCEAQWQAYLSGEQEATIAEGRITELFYAPHEGEHMFRLDEGASQSSWVRHGDESWYAVGRHAKVERVVFRVPHPIGDMPVVTRIWIGKGAEPDAAPSSGRAGQLPVSPDVQSSDSPRTPFSGGCG